MKEVRTVKGPLSTHLRPQHLHSGRGIPPVETTPQGHRKEKAKKDRWWRRGQFRKRYTGLNLIFLIGPALTALYVAYTEVPSYRAEASLLIDSHQGHLSGKDQPRDRIGGGATTNGDKTQYELLKSHSLVSRVIREQGLVFLSDANGESWRQQQLVTVDTGDHDTDIKLRTIEEYLANLEVLPVPETRLVKVAYRTTTAIAGDEGHLPPDPKLRVEHAKAAEHTDTEVHVERGATEVSAPPAPSATATVDNSEGPTPSGARETICVTEEVVANSNDSFSRVKGDIDEPRVDNAHGDESQRDGIVTADLNRAQPS
jgi:hypothetical protein